jgi:hypothetical protein
MTEQIKDELAEVKKFIGLADPATEKLRAERAEADRARQATITAKRAELADLEASMVTVGREAETQIRQGFKSLALYFVHARTRRRLVADLNNLAHEREHIPHESTLVEHVSKWVGAQIKQVTGKMDGFGLLKFKLSTVMPSVDAPLFKTERK